MGDGVSTVNSGVAQCEVDVAEGCGGSISLHSILYSNVDWSRVASSAGHADPPDRGRAQRAMARSAATLVRKRRLI